MLGYAERSFWAACLEHSNLFKVDSIINIEWRLTGIVHFQIQGQHTLLVEEKEVP